MKIYDITTAAVDSEQITLALFDNRYNSIMVIKPIINEDSGKPELDVLEPDGAERLYWLEKFGMITEEEFQAEVKQLAPQANRLKLYQLLKKEYEEAV